MKIARVDVIALEAPFAALFGGAERVPAELAHPAANQATVPRRGQCSTIVRVVSDDGVEGIGEAFALPAAEITATIIARYLRPLLLGRDPLETTVIWDLLYGAQRGGGHSRGFMLDAIAGVDIALWDLKGKALGLPVYQLLGGACRDRVPVYVSPVPFTADPAASARAARAFVEQGYRRLKLKVGRGIETDLAHVAAVRKAIGPAASLMLDLNCGYDARAALDLAHELRPYDPFWLEEPVPPEDLAGLAEVRHHAGTRVVTGECEATAFGMRDILLRGAADALQPNIAKAGGFTECVRIGDLARLFNVQIAPHGVGSGLAIAAALHWCATLPHLLFYEHNQFLNPLREAVLNEPLVRDGDDLLLPSGPGLGVTLNEAAIEEFVVARF